jgi:hypothetical protein
VVSGRDSGGLGGGIVASGRDPGGLGGIVALRRDSSRLGGEIVASGRDSNGAGRGMEGFGRVHAIARFLGGSNCCKAFRFVLLLA